MKKNRNPSREKAQAAHMERLNEIRSYGIDVKDKGLYGGAEYGLENTLRFQTANYRTLATKPLKSIRENS